MRPMRIYVLSMDCMNRNSYEDGEDSTAVNPPAHHAWDPDVSMQEASDSDVEEASDSDVGGGVGLGRRGGVGR